MGIIRLKVKDYCSVASFLGRINIDVEALRTVLVCEPLRVLEDGLDRIEYGEFALRRTREDRSGRLFLIRVTLNWATLK